MGRKQNEKSRSVKSRHVYSRLSFLYQAATHFTQRQPEPVASEIQGVGHASDKSTPPRKAPRYDGMARMLATDLRTIALKMQLRLSPAMKSKVCRYCDTILVEGTTCSVVMENKSKGGKKPWADVMVWKCESCGREKRYPVNAKRQPKRSRRQSGQENLAVKIATASEGDEIAAG
jgi:ribonuclease P protein subunit RPR2